MSASTAVLKIEAKLLARELGSVFWMLVFPSMLLICFGLIPKYREVNPNLGGHRIIDLMVPSTLLVALITASLQSMPIILTGYRERGILRRLRTTPARPSHLLMAQMVLHAGAALLSALLVLLLGYLVYDVALPRRPFVYLTTLILATSSGLAIGAVLTALCRTVKAATAVGVTAIFPAMFTAGIYVPIQVLPEPVRRGMELFPFGSAAQALSQAANGNWPSWGYFVVLGLWTVVMIGVAVRWFRWE